MHRKIWVALLAASCLALCGTMAAVADPPATHTNSLGMEFVLIPAGSFLLEHDKDADSTLPRRKVNITKPFYLGKYQVTQEQWEAVMGNNPSQFKGPNNPLESANRSQVREFIKRLNAKEGHDRYRLPTEMEWELAARGGTGAADPLDDYAWFDKNSGGTTHPVGQKKPNPYGLYDIYGNVFEWMEDLYGELPTSREITDYRAEPKHSWRWLALLRGGSWKTSAEYCRSGRAHILLVSNIRPADVGLRLALSPE